MVKENLFNVFCVMIKPITYRLGNTDRPYAVYDCKDDISIVLQTIMSFEVVCSPLPLLVILSWLTSLRCATLPWFEPDRGLSPSIDDQAKSVASEIANCCRIPEGRVQKDQQGSVRVTPRGRTLFY